MNEPLRSAALDWPDRFHALTKTGDDSGWRGLMHPQAADRMAWDRIQQWVDGSIEHATAERRDSVTGDDEVLDVVRRPGRRVSRLGEGDASVFAKIMLRRSDADKGIGPLYDAIRFRCRAPRSLAVLKICTRLQQAGFAVPTVLYAAGRRAGLTTHALLVTETAPGRTLQDRLIESVVANEPERQSQALVENLAGLAADLHVAGFTHGDFLAGNVMAEDHGRLWLLDNDRTRYWPQFLGKTQLLGPPTAAQHRNLKQAATNLRIVVGWRFAAAFLQAYAERRGLSDAARRAMKRSVGRHVRQRAQQHRQQLRNADVSDTLPYCRAGFDGMAAMRKSLPDSHGLPVTGGGNESSGHASH